MGSATILSEAYRVIAGKLPVPTKPGMCLAMVRHIVEEAFDVEPYGFYRRLIIPNFHLREGEWLATVSSSTNGHDAISPYWARGAERALRDAGLARHNVSDMLPGDLLFSWMVSRPYGHVGIYLDGGLVLENTTAERGWLNDKMGAVRITPLREFSPVTTVISADKLSRAFAAY